MSKIEFATADGRTFALDMTEIYALEARKDEVSTVSKLQAPELMRALEKGYSETAKKAALVMRELDRAEEAISIRKSQVLLEIVPQYEDERKKQTTAEIRNSLVVTDEQYRSFIEIRDNLKGLNKFMKDKLKGFEMAFSTVKRVYDNLNKIGMDTMPEDLGSRMGKQTSGVGKPRY